MNRSASLLAAAFRRHNRQHPALQMLAPCILRGSTAAATMTTSSSSSGCFGDNSLPARSPRRTAASSHHPMHDPSSSLVSTWRDDGMSPGAVAAGLRGFPTTAVLSGDGRSCAGRATPSNHNGTAGTTVRIGIEYHLGNRWIGAASAMTAASRSLSSATAGVTGSTEGHDDDASLVDELADEDDGGVAKVPGWDLLHSPPRGKMIRGSLVGTVVSDKMQKTVNVAVDRYRIVPKYRKRVRYTRKFMAHDEEEVCNVGDLVMIVPDRRRSRHKHFRVHEIIRAKGIL